MEAADPDAPPADVQAPEGERPLAQLGPVDTVVCVSGGRDEPRTLDVLAAASAALVDLLPGRPTAVLVADQSPGDGARDAIRSWCEAEPAGPARRCLGPGSPLGPPAVQRLLAAARQLGSPACAFVHADRGRLATRQLAALLRPVLEKEADLAVPAYSRAISEGTLASNLLVPLTRALYGRRISQLAGGCLALGSRLVARCLDGPGPDHRWSGPGLEIWLATEALAGDARVAEVGLGVKAPNGEGAADDLSTTLVRTVGPVFALMERYPAWQEAYGTSPVPRYGEPVVALPEPARAGLDRLVRGFQLGLKDLLPVWEQIMPEVTLTRLYPLGLSTQDDFRFPPELWARVVSDFAVTHHERRLPQDHLLRALTPLYLGRVAAFLLDARSRPPDQVERILESVAAAFEAEKPELVARWR